MPDCFISYSSNDERFAAAVRKDLVAHGLSVFMAKISLNPGDRWVPATLTALAQSPWVIFLASKAACDSPYVQQEIGGALIAQKRLIPVVWEMPPSELPGWVSQIQALDIRNQTPLQIKARIIGLAQQIKATKEKGVLIGAALATAFIWLLGNSD
ncbi:MAG: toll/interleukin-1 receptor domain-containing protein [Nitrospira sp. WS110]|nr:toll/interleukin-1 receptor domain-containing protein [Nitrospira sp. WS110]